MNTIIKTPQYERFTQGYQGSLGMYALTKESVTSMNNINNLTTTGSWAAEHGWVRGSRRAWRVGWWWGLCEQKKTCLLHLKGRHRVQISVYFNPTSHAVFLSPYL